MSPKLVTLKQCFQHYNERFPRKDKTPERLFLAQFAETAKEQTIQDWLREKSKPAGEYKWRAVAFFALLGYPIDAYVRVRPVIQRAIELLALDVVTAQTLVKKGFGFSSTNATSEMYVVLGTNRAMLPEREIALERFVAEHTGDLLAAKQLFDEQYGAIRLDVPEITLQPKPVVGIQPEQPAAAVRPLRPVVSAVVRPKLSHDTILNSAANLVQGLLPLLELIASDAFSAAERAQLRERAGGDGIFKLSNVLEDLCGERARNQSTK